MVAAPPILRNNSIDATDLHLPLVYELDLTVQSEWRTRREHLDQDLADGCCGCLVRSLQVDACLKGHVIVPFCEFPLSCCHQNYWTPWRDVGA